MKLTDLKNNIECLQTNLKDLAKEIVEEIDKRFIDILQETKIRKAWYDKGKCYKCGSPVYPINVKHLGTAWRCQNCHKDLYDDDLTHYYYYPIIEKLLELAEEMTIE